MGLLHGIPQFAVVYIGGTPVKVHRCRLGSHLRLEALWEKATHERELFAESMVEYVRVALGNDGELVDSMEFFDFVGCVDSLWRLNQLVFIPPFMRTPSKKQSAPPWSYSERSHGVWFHLLASHYGWSVDEIDGLIPEEALLFIQEILIDQQLELEKEWTMSGASWVWNKQTKRSEFKALPRPPWMVDRKPPQKIQIPKALIPVGRVVDLGDWDAPGATEKMRYIQ